MAATRTTQHGGHTFLDTPAPPVCGVVQSRPELSTRSVGTRYRARRGGGSALSTHTTLHRPSTTTRFYLLRGLGYGVCAAYHRHTHDARTPRSELSTRAVGTRYRARRGRDSASSTHTTPHRPSTTTRFNERFTGPRLRSVRGVPPAHSRCTHPARAETLAHPAGLMASPPTFPAPYIRRVSAQRTPRTTASRETCVRVSATWDFSSHPTTPAP